GVQVVHRNLGGDGLGGVHALEVDVQDQGHVGVPLNGTHQDRLGLAVQDHVQDGSVEFFLVQGVVDLVVVELDIVWCGLATVDDGGHPTGAAQAAARTRTLDATRSGGEFHGKLQKGALEDPRQQSSRSCETPCAATSAGP